MQILVVVANTPERPWRTNVEKAWAALDSRTVAMEFRIRYGVCNH